MLMAPADEITGRAKELLAALQSGGEWMNRHALADATGKNRLSPHDVDLLGRMVEQGLIEERTVDIPGPLKKAYEYKAK